MTYEKYLEAVKQLNIWTRAYDEGNPIVSDEVWDNLYFQVVEYEKENNITNPVSPTSTISYTVVNQLNKVKHNHLMLSLDKTKSIEELSRFISKNECVIMPKLDGLTCSLRYENGVLVAAETRGNGEIGEDILHNAKVIKNIPQIINHSGTLIVDGEVICKYKDFKSFEDLYKNPRNFASGSLKLLDSKECNKRQLSFIAWDCIQGIDAQTLSYKLSMLAHNYKFETAFSFILNKSNASAVEDYIQTIKDYCNSPEYSYPIDGIVVKYNNIEFYNNCGSTNHHFNGGIAFKFYDETYSSKLKAIDWTMGRTGQLTPTAVFDPIEIDGTIVERASLHNVSIMHQILGPCVYYDEPVEIYKANQIIPQVYSAGPHYTYDEVINNNMTCIEQIDTCPICGAPVEFRQDGIAEICYCSNPNCEGKLINKLDHFCGKKGLDIKGLSKATLEKLVDWNWIEDFKDIYNLNSHRNEWIKRPGFGVSSVDKILSAIEASKNTELWRFIAAAGIPEIGVSASKTLANYYKNWNSFREAVSNNDNFGKLPDFGYIMNNNIHNYNFDNLDHIASLMNFKEIEGSGTQMLLGKQFCITGKITKWKNRDELKQWIESHGGKVTGSVTSKTDYLINNDTNSITAKNLTAKKLNIPIISEIDFLALIDDLLAI